MHDIFPYTMIIFGLIFIAVFSKSITTYISFNEFIVCNGVILSHEIEESHNSQSGTHYSPRIRYKYKINNSEHIGSSISDIEHSQEHTGYAEKVFSKYPISANVKVYVNPKNHKTAFLERNKVADIALPLIFGAGLVAGGIAMLASS